MIQPGSSVAVIPCWNEVQTIGPLVREVRSRLDAVLVVDDGSTDDSAAQAATAGAHVLRHPLNQGKGAALRRGFRWAIRQGFDWAVTLDADGQHAPEDLPALFARRAATGAALVIGNRMAGADAMPWLRRVVNRAMSRELSRRAGQHFPDSQCGFRLMRLDAWDRLQLETRHFEAESETLIGFVAAGFRVEFVPVRVLPAPRPSRIRPVRDTWRWLQWWWASRPTRTVALQTAGSWGA